MQGWTDCIKMLKSTATPLWTVCMIVCTGDIFVCFWFWNDSVRYLLEIGLSFPWSHLPSPFCSHEERVSCLEIGCLARLAWCCFGSYQFRPRLLFCFFFSKKKKRLYRHLWWARLLFVSLRWGSGMSLREHAERDWLSHILTCVRSSTGELLIYEKKSTLF